MALAIAEYVAEVLVQRAPKCHVQHLNTTTNRQQRLVLSNRFSHHGELEVVVRLDDPIHRVAATRFAIAGRVDVSATLEKHTVHRCDEVRRLDLLEAGAWILSIIDPFHEEFHAAQARRYNDEMLTAYWKANRAKHTA